MKRLAIFALALGMTLPLVAQERWKSHFMAGASAEFTVGSTSNDNLSKRDYADYWGTSITGGYKWFVHKGLFILPELSFYYENHDMPGDYPLFGRPDGPKMYDCDTHTTETGFAIDAMVGYNLPGKKNISVDIMTGPYFSCAFSQHQNTQYRIGQDSDLEHHYGFDLANKTSFRWRFALGVNVWRMTVKAAFDVSVTDLKENRWDNYPVDGYDGREHHVVSFGVAYNF